MNKQKHKQKTAKSDTEGKKKQWHPEKMKIQSSGHFP